MAGDHLKNLGSRVLLMFTLILVFLGSLAPTGTGDFFMSLTLGRLLFSLGTLPALDPYLFTIPDYHWHVWHEWLSHAYYYKLFSAVGFGGVIVVRALWLTLFAYIFWRSGRAPNIVWPSGSVPNPISIPPVVLAPVLLLIFMVAFERCRLDRACFFGDLLVAGMVMALLYIDRGQAGQTAQAPKWIWWFPVVFLFWVNWHGSFPLGLFFLVAYIAFRFSGWSRPERKRWVSVMALSLLATLVNPLGPQALLWPLNVHNEFSQFQKVNSEWLPFYSNAFGQGMRWRVGAFLAVGLLIAALGLRRGKWFEFLVSVILTYACFSSVRFVGIAAFGIGAVIVQELRSWSWPRTRQTVAAACTPLVAGAVLFLQPGYGAYWPSGIMNGQYFIPNVAYAAAKHLAQLPPGNVFNEYDMGGLLAWELNGRMKIAAHGHIHQATLAIDHYWRYQRSPEDFRDIIGKGQVEYFIALKSDLDATPGSGWVEELNKYWLTIYSDGVAVIFKRIYNYQ